jgi:hypothetical protein
MKGMTRPKAVILDQHAIVPDHNIISPAPNQFTHKLTESEPYYFHEAQQGTEPDGEFAEGTKVALLWYDGGEYCRVADGQGLYVEIAHAGLKKL